MTISSFFSPAQIFQLSSSLAALAWLGLAFSPYQATWSARVRFISGRLVPLVFAAIYVVLFAANGMGDGGFDSIEAVQRLLARPELLTAGWLHYLAFDLFVGSWIAARAGQLGFPHWLILPLLALTFLFGPAGLLSFAVVRSLRRTGRGAVVGPA